MQCFEECIREAEISDIEAYMQSLSLEGDAGWFKDSEERQKVSSMLLDRMTKGESLEEHKVLGLAFSFILKRSQHHEVEARRMQMKSYLAHKIIQAKYQASIKLLEEEVAKLTARAA